MRSIQKIPNKDGMKSYKAQVRLSDGLPPQSNSFPSMTSKQDKLDELIAYRQSEMLRESLR